jgi:hypothetical protein
MILNSSFNLQSTQTSLPSLLAIGRYKKTWAKKKQTVLNGLFLDTPFLRPLAQY